MSYQRVQIAAIGYELAPVVVTTEELEERLAPTLQALRVPSGQLEAMTGILERRYWEPGYPLSEGAAAAARKALARAAVPANELGALIYAGVCREHFEPATACHVAAALAQNGQPLRPDATIYDLSNACLGVLNGMLELANRIELGQIRAGMVVSCESARDIVEIAVARMLAQPDMPTFSQSLATLTGGSGAVAVLLTDGSFARRDGAPGDASPRRRLVCGVTHAAPEHHQLCRWGIDPVVGTEGAGPAAHDGIFQQFMSTDSVAVLQHGVALGKQTWQAFTRELAQALDVPAQGAVVDRVVCHQVGSAHRETILRELGIAPDNDFVTYDFLGNTGTVALPLALALADKRGFLQAGQRVGLLGIGSGLNCLMLGVLVSQQLYPFAGQTLDLDGLRYHYVDEGPRTTAHAVLMVHGNPSWSFYYRELIRALCPEHRVIAPDHIGCGRSDKPTDDRYSYTLARRVADLERLVEQLGLERVTLVVHDWGGMIGMAWATRHPDLVERLVVMNTGAFQLPDAKSFPPSLRLARLPLLGALLVRGFSAFSRGANRFGVTRKPMSPEVAEGYLAPYDSWAHRIAVHRFVQDIPLHPGDEAYTLVSDTAAKLELLRAKPMLICWGLRDFVFDRHFLAEWERRFPDAHVERFDDAGHYVLEDARDEIVSAVQRFVGRPRQYLAAGGVTWGASPLQRWGPR